MSKKSKSEAKLRRRAMKRARKAAQRALYEARKRAGQNTKSKRNKLRAKRTHHVRVERHRSGPCGNVGCPKCNPALAR
jgi:DNA-directed RNA polymerase subunit M/transcription elongation factor TFIIS